MSLPPAPKDISDHPQKGSVVDPVNKDLKDADVDRKMRFYGVIEAFRQGRMPDNKQIDQTLLYVRDNSPVPLNELSPQGRKLIEDSRDIIETARLMVKEKNADELFQNFVWHTSGTDFEKAKTNPADHLPVDQTQAQKDADKAVEHLRTLLHLVLTNSEVRKLLTDFSLIGRDLLAKGAAKAAGKIAPSDEQMARVDEAAPADEFRSGDRTFGPNDTPVLEERIPGTDHTFRSHPQNGVAVHTADGQVKDYDQLKAEATSTANDAANQAAAVGQSHAQDVQANVDNVPDEEKGDVAKSTLKDKLRGFRDDITGRIPQEHKDRANEQMDRTKQFFSEEYFPPERRDQFIYRGKKVILECQKHSDYQESITWLIDFIETYFNHAKTATKSGGGSVAEVKEDPKLNLAIRELRTLLERFANGKSFQPIIDALQNLADDAQNDEGLRNWISEVDTYIRKCLLEAGYVLQPACDTRARELRDSGRQFYDEKYKGHFDNLFDQIGGWFGAMGDDPLNKRFGQDWARLTKDLLFDSEGKLTFKPDLWADIRKTILPSIIDRVGYVPIPRIEYTDDMLDLVVENLTLSGRNLFPNFITMEAHNFMKFSPYNSIKDERHHEFTLTFGQIQADMRDVAFYYKNRRGIKISDSGLADVVLGGEGLTATVHLSSAEKDHSSVFHVKDVHVKIDTLKFSIRDAKHELLYKTIRPLATGLIKKQIQKAVADAIRTGLEYVDGQLVGVRDRMAEAKDSDETSRTQVLADMFKSKADTAQSVKSKTDSHFKVVSKRDSLLLPDQGHPTGLINRSNERAQAASSGSEWRSEA
ncbi:hypothetical protein SISSUDRAFT_986068 [Sistotremastrum suecicum HHB10207 ss-3]|uniref:Uncharacterized protein n=1 Tax=Sistotremastrum suecicum HHB10207 ss-3 TaxID=1314776 RepID=A0A166DHD2_9AGAM|nr:hypothetical protein SISSUDRAFT_986068 [Sistotremastrum suecicum HHB10207 ss-3]